MQQAHRSMQSINSSDDRIFLAEGGQGKVCFEPHGNPRTWEITKEAAEGRGVRLRGGVAKAELVEEFRGSRCMLYRGDINETFCLAVGEAQAMGVPAVVQNLGSVSERVIDGETGSIVVDDSDFVDAAVRLLTDDELWQRQQAAALQKQRRWRWPDAAARFEGFLT